jgi:hypothetical protein
VSNGVCAACGRSIDAAAKLCPYCGADPVSGQRVVDTQAILQEVFHPRELSTTENVLEFARQRQGIVIAVSLFVAFLILAGLHQFVTMRNAGVETGSPAVPLTEITDVANQKSEVTPVPMPKLDFPYEGRPQAMRTFIVERGAVAPAPPAPATGTQPPGTVQPATPQPAATQQQAPPRPPAPRQ